MSLHLYVVDLDALCRPFAPWAHVVTITRLPEATLWKLLVGIADVMPWEEDMKADMLDHLVDTQQDLFGFFYDDHGITHPEYEDDPVLANALYDAERQVVNMATVLRRQLPRDVTGLQYLTWDALTHTLHLEMELP